MGKGRNGNLIPPVKGEVRNPNGKPKGTIHIKTLAKRIFDDPKTWESLPVPKAKITQLKKYVGDDKKYGEALIYAWLSKALTDPRFASIILELTDGKGKIELDPAGGIFAANKLRIEIVGNNKPKAKPKAKRSPKHSK